MKKLLLAATMLCALVSGANAVTVLATDVGATGTTSIQGLVEVNGNAVVVPGLTAELELTYLGMTGTTWNFSYDITNTTQGILGLTSRLSSWGLTTTPNVVSASISGSDIWTFAPTQVQLAFGGVIDFCASDNPNQCSSGAGLAPGESDDGFFSLTFASLLTSITLDNAYARFQSIDGSVFNFNGASGVGINPVQITPFAVVPGPAVGAGLPALMAGVLGLLGFQRLRRRKLMA